MSQLSRHFKKDKATILRIAISYLLDPYPLPWWEGTHRWLFPLFPNDLYSDAYHAFEEQRSLSEHMIFRLYLKEETVKDSRTERDLYTLIRLLAGEGAKTSEVWRRLRCRATPSPEPLSTDSSTQGPSSLESFLAEFGNMMPFEEYQCFSLLRRGETKWKAPQCVKMAFDALEQDASDAGDTTRKNRAFSSSHSDSPFQFSLFLRSVTTEGSIISLREPSLGGPSTNERQLGRGLADAGE